VRFHLVRAKVALVASIALALTAQLSCGTADQDPGVNAAQRDAQLRLDVKEICKRSGEGMQRAFRESDTAEELVASRLRVNRRMTHELGTLAIPPGMTEGFYSLQRTLVARHRLTVRLLAIVRAHRAPPPRLMAKRNALGKRAWRYTWDMDLDCRYYERIY
jgi:hypothetical protein